MDEGTFQRELSKFKVIRSPDYYRPRLKPKPSKNTLVTGPSVSSKETAAVPVIKEASTGENNFWELLSAANTSILTAVESIKFIEAMKLVSMHVDMIMIINIL